MAVEAVASVVLQKLTDLVKEEESVTNQRQRVIVDQLEKIKKEVEIMGGYFIDAETKQETNIEVKQWSDNYLRHLYDVEDAIESFALRIARQRKRLGFLMMNHALFLKNFTACRKLSRKMKRIRSRIIQLNNDKPNGVEDASIRANSDLSPTHQVPSALNFGTTNGDDAVSPSQELGEEDDHSGDGKWPLETLKENTEVYSSQCSVAATSSNNRSICLTKENVRSLSKESQMYEHRRQSKLMYSYSYDEEELDIVGFKQDVQSLVYRLLNEEDDVVISIVGDLGSGKTTLTRAVYGNSKIKDHFKSCCAWVTVSRDSTIIDLLLNLLKQVGDFKDQGGLITRDLLQTRLLERLKDRRYLIVFDDVWCSELGQQLRSAIPDSGNGGKIILTTCREQVATANTKNRPHYLKRLTNSESWELFFRKASLAEYRPSDDLKQKILERCNGIPQSIVLLGSLLSTKSYDKWHGVLHWGTNWNVMDILVLSYNDLPPHLQLCLLYMVLFPKEFDIPVRRLLRLWRAEGFVKRPEKPHQVLPEDVALEYFENLVKRSLIQISKWRSDGSSPRKCRLLGILHDYLLPKARDIRLFHLHRSPSCNEDGGGSFPGRRLVEHVNLKDCHLDSPNLKPQRLRSYISFNFQKKDTPAKEVGNVLRRIMKNGYGLLRVLDLEGVYKPSLPDNLGDIFHLRYLGLRWTFLDSLPASVGDLSYLEVLDIKHTYINSLPASIWKLKHLRDLNLNEIRLDMPKHCHSSLPRLLTLWGLSVVDDGSPIKSGLDKLTHLRELGITFSLSDCGDLVDWVSKLTALQSLRLRSKDDMGRPSDLSFKSFSSLVNLSHLNLLGKLPKLPDKNELPQMLKVLTLSVSKLKEDPMPVLGQIRSLKVLRLLADSYLGTRMTCPMRGFEELRVLKLWKLKNLEEWNVEDGAMERLKELNIRCCNRLRSIPRRLLQQQSLKELVLTNMPKEFKENVERHKSMHLFVTIKDYNFTPLPWDDDEDDDAGSANGVHSAANGADG